MTTVLALILAAVLFLAYSNGANDNFKGVATLFGSGTCGYRTALVWATVTTLAGSLLALVLAHGLVAAFTGKGLVPDAVTVQPAFLLSVGFGAALTVLLATNAGLPVSTTHALTGGLVGAGLLATAGDVHFAALGTSILLPLLFSPVAAMVLTVVIYPLFRFARRGCGVTSQSCICVGKRFEEIVAQPDGSVMLVRTGAVVEVGQISQCVERYQGQMLGIQAGPVLDGLHCLSSGAVGLARGLNDTPKIVGAPVGCGSRFAQPGPGAGRLFHGGGRHSQCPKSGRNHESQDNSHEPRSRVHGEFGDGRHGYRSQPPGIARFHNSRFRGIAVRDWRRQRDGQVENDFHDPAGLGHDLAAGGGSGSDFLSGFPGNPHGRVGRVCDSHPRLNCGAQELFRQFLWLACWRARGTLQSVKWDLRPLAARTAKVPLPAEVARRIGAAF